jgi:hypothetical protein
MEEFILPVLSEYIKNFVWITDYDREHQFIQSIKSREVTGVLSCSKKHYEAWRLFRQSGDDYCLVLEDDVMFVEDIDVKKEFSSLLNLIGPDDIIVTIGSGCNIHGKKKGLSKEGAGRCSDSYILNKNYLDIWKDEECYEVPVGGFMNTILCHKNILWTYFEPSIFYQGSQNATYFSNIRDF